MRLFPSFYDAVSYVFSSYSKSKPYRQKGLDKDTRNPAHTRMLLDALQAPDRDQTNIKVTGSKGKGSTARLLAGFLQSQGLKVGLFTSPHLIDFTERIRVNGMAISESDFMRLLSYVKPHLDAIQSAFKPHEYFGPVGVTAVVSSLYFKEQTTDVNVIELGRGARYDDVNVMSGQLAVITPIHLEHADYLGPTLKDIAYNKAGIITPGLKGVIIGAQSLEVAAILREEAERCKVPLFALGDDFSVLDTRVTKNSTLCTIDSLYSRYDDLLLGMIGRHQADNAAVALATIEALTRKALDHRAAYKSAASMKWIGRGYLLNRKPLVLIDGAINRESASYLVEQIRSIGSSKAISVVGVPEDKDYGGMYEVLSEVVDEFIVTVASNPHLKFPSDGREKASTWRPSLKAESLQEAVELAESLLPEDGLLIIAGTQSLVADAVRYYALETRDLSSF